MGKLLDNGVTIDSRLDKPEKKSQDEILSEMDASAELAGKDLEKLNQKSVTEVADWWKANFMKAGHKRLGRILIKYATKKKVKE